MWPMPLVELICSTTTRASSAEVTAKRMPSRKPGIAPGSTTVRTNVVRLQPDGLGELGVAPVDGRAARCGCGCRRARARPSAMVMIFISSPIPNHRISSGMQRQARDGPLDLHGPVDDRTRRAGTARTTHGEHGAHRDTDRQPEPGPRRGDDQVLLEPAVGDQVAGGADHGPGRGQGPLVDEDRPPTRRPRSRSGGGGRAARRSGSGVPGPRRRRTTRWSVPVRPAVRRRGREPGASSARYLPRWPRRSRTGGRTCR